MIFRIRISHEDAFNLVAVGRGTCRDRGELFGRRSARRDCQYRGSGAYQPTGSRFPLVNDGNHHSQTRIGPQLEVRLIGNRYLQMVTQCRRRRRGCACGPQGRRDSGRAALGSYDQSGLDTLGCGERRQLRTYRKGFFIRRKR